MRTRYIKSMLLGSLIIAGILTVIMPVNPSKVYAFSSLFSDPITLEEVLPTASWPNISSNGKLAVNDEGNIYAAWVNYGDTGDISPDELGLWFSRSSNGGAQFSTPVKLLDGNIGFDITTSGDNIYLAYTEYYPITLTLTYAYTYLIISSDGGQTFGDAIDLSHILTDGNSGINDEYPAAELIGTPIIAIDGDDIYLLYLRSTNPHGNDHFTFYDTYLEIAKSSDGGSTFSRIPMTPVEEDCVLCFADLFLTETEIYVGWSQSIGSGFELHVEKVPIGPFIDDFSPVYDGIGEMDSLLVSGNNIYILSSLGFVGDLLITSADGGATFTDHIVPSDYETNWNDMALTQDGSNIYLAGIIWIPTSDGGDRMDLGVVKTEDGGQTFEEFNVSQGDTISSFSPSFFEPSMGIHEEDVYITASKLTLNGNPTHYPSSASFLFIKTTTEVLDGGSSLDGEGTSHGTITSAYGTTIIDISNGGTIDDADNTDPATLPDPPVSLSFPNGIYSFDINVQDPGDTVRVTIEMPNDVPAGAAYWKYDDATWITLPNNRVGDNDGDNVLEIKLTDGGIGDSDGVANGVIQDPGGPAMQKLILHSTGSANLKKAASGITKGNHDVEVEIEAFYTIVKGKPKIDKESISGTLTIDDTTTYELDVKTISISRNLKTISYEANLDSVQGSVSGILQFASPIDFVNGDGLDAKAGKNTLKAKIAKTVLDCKKTPTGEIEFE